MDQTQVRAAIEDGRIRIRRSPRRKKTVSLSRDHAGWLLAVPQHYDPVRNAQTIAGLIERIERRAARTPESDAELLERAGELNARYFADGVEPASVRWVDNQRSRFASTTSSDRSIRVSSRLREVPEWVLDAVLVHELAHLRRPDHSQEFKALTARYPETERADVFLAGFSAGEHSAWAESGRSG